MKWKVQIEWTDDHDISLEDEYLIVTNDEIISDEEVFFFVEDEEELERLTIPCYCDDFLILGYTKIE